MKYLPILTALIFVLLFEQVVPHSRHHREHHSKHRMHARRRSYKPLRRRLTTKHHRAHNKPSLSHILRKLLGMPGKKIKADSLAAFTSTPQIDAPRMLITNFSKPPDADYRYPQQNTIDAPGPPNMTILPPKIVSTDGEDNTAMSRVDVIKNARRLTQDKTPDLSDNIEPIRLQIPMEALRPKRARRLMAPPRQTEIMPRIHNPLAPGTQLPPPIVLELQDRDNMESMENAITAEELAVHKVRMNSLTQRIEEEILGFNDDLKTVVDKVGSSMKEIDDKATEMSTGDQQIIKEAKDLFKEIL